MNGVFAFVAASALVAASATMGVSLLRLRARIDVVLAWALLASTAALTTILVAGAIFHHLAAWLVVVLNLLLTGILALFWLATGHSPRSLGRNGLRSAQSLADDLRGDRWLLALLSISAAEVAWRLVIAWVMPPYAGDALWYHLTTVGGWIQTGRIGPNSLSIWSTVHPQHGELLFAWPAVLLGNDQFVDSVQLPFALVGAIAVAGIGRTGGLSRRGAAAAGCLFLLTPIVLSQTTASYTDVICIAFVLIAFHFILRLAETLRSSNEVAESGTSIFLAGLAGGLAIGTKALGIVYVGVLFVVLLSVLVIACRNRRVSRARLAWSVAAFVALVLSVGAYHYIETWARFGNPFYPVRIAGLGIELFDGRSAYDFLSSPPDEGTWWREIWGQWHADHFFLTHPRFHAYSYDGRPSGLGPLWSYLGFPVLLAYAAWLALRNRGWLLILLLPIGAMFALQPYRWWSRFTMILAAVGAIAIVALVEAAGPRLSSVLKAAVAVLVGLGIFFPTLKIDGEFWANRIFAVGRLPAEERTIGRVALAGYRWVDAVPPEAVIGVDKSSAHFGGQPYVLAYPLFGPDFGHAVYPLPSASFATFREAIARREITYVFVARGKRLDGWAKLALVSGCARLVYDGLVYAGEAGRAYRIVPHCEWPQA